MMPITHRPAWRRLRRAAGGKGPVIRRRGRWLSWLMAAWLGCGLAPTLAQAQSPSQAPAPAQSPAPARKDPATSARESKRAEQPGPRPHVQAVRILTTRSHSQCPLPGQKIAVLSIDSPQEWAETLQKDEASVAGRSIRWSREQVLVYAMNQQPTLGVSVEPASRVLSLNSGVLMWPVREIRPGPGQMAATALSRPCLVAIVKRAYWQRIRIVRKH